MSCGNTVGICENNWKNAEVDQKERGSQLASRGKQEPD